MSAINAWVRSRRDPSASRTLVRTLLQLFPQLSSSALDSRMKLLVAPVSMVVMNVYPPRTNSARILFCSNFKTWFTGSGSFPGSFSGPPPLEARSRSPTPVFGSTQQHIPSRITTAGWSVVRPRRFLGLGQSLTLQMDGLLPVSTALPFS